MSIRDRGWVEREHSPCEEWVIHPLFLCEGEDSEGEGANRRSHQLLKGTPPPHHKGDDIVRGGSVEASGSRPQYGGCLDGVALVEPTHLSLLPLESASPSILPITCSRESHPSSLPYHPSMPGGGCNPPR